jgi:hypothetical protein
MVASRGSIITGIGEGVGAERGAPGSDLATLKGEEFEGEYESRCPMVWQGADSAREWAFVPLKSCRIIDRALTLQRARLSSLGAESAFGTFDEAYPRP